MGFFWFIVKILAWAFGILLGAGFIITFAAWRFAKFLKRDVDLKLADWDVIAHPSMESLQTVAAATPGQFGLIGSIVRRWFYHRYIPKLLSRNRDELDAADLNALAEAYDNGGPGFPRDPAEAFRLYIDADSRHGHAWATMRAAEMLEDGEGTPRDPDRALSYYVRSAASVSAMLHVARRRFEGDGMTRDLVKAYELLLVADKFGDHLFAQTEVRRKIEREDVRAARRHLVVRRLLAQVASEMSPEERNAALTRAVTMWSTGRVDLGVNAESGGRIAG